MSLQNIIRSISNSAGRFANWSYTHKKSSVGGAVAIIAGGLLGHSYLTGGETIYTGQVRLKDNLSVRVSYVENEGIRGERNRMNVRNGADSYELLDIDGTIIGWDSITATGFGTDELDEVVYSRAGKSETFRVEDIGDGTLKGSETEDILKRANRNYNEIRGKIRDKKVEETLTSLGKVKNGLPGA